MRLRFRAKCAEDVKQTILCRRLQTNCTLCHVLVSERRKVSERTQAERRVSYDTLAAKRIFQRQGG